MSRVGADESAGKASAVGRWYEIGRLNGDVAGAFTGTLLSLPQAMSLGVLALAALGPAAASVGVLAALLASIVGNVVATAIPAVRCQVMGARASATAIVAALVASLAAEPSIAGPAGAEVSQVLALVAVAVGLAGVLQAIFGLTGIGHAVKFIPYPVVAGFMNGIALMILASQLRPALGLPGQASLLATLGDLANAHLGSLATAATTLLVILAAPRFLPRVPGIISGLLAGVAMHYVVAFVAPGAAGEVVGPLPSALHIPEQLGETWNALRVADLAILAKVVAPAAVLLAVVCAVEGLLAAVVVDGATRGRHDGNRLLVSQGVANMAGALVGALPAVLNTNTPIASYLAGARSRLASLLQALFVLAALVALGPLVAGIPIAALAGIMVYIAFTLIDRWSRDLVLRLRDGRHGRRDVAINLAIVLGVAAAQVMLNVLVALAVGFAASVAMLLVRLSGSPVRRSVDGSRRASLKVRGPEARAALKALEPRIRIIELQGELFFGTADRLQGEVEALPEEAAIAILDFRRVNSIDATGARVLEVVAQRSARRRMAIVLSHVGPGDARGDYLRGLGLESVIPGERWFPDLDCALEWAEDELLKHSRFEDAAGELPLAGMALLRDLDPDDLERLEKVLERRELRKGEFVFREGEEGDRMFFIARGTVNIALGIEGARRAMRLATFSPGLAFGEMALIEGGRRSADAVASADEVVVFSLSARALELLVQEDPTLGLRLHRNIARELASRLRATSGALRALE